LIILWMVLMETPKSFAASVMLINFIVFLDAIGLTGCLGPFKNVELRRQHQGLPTYILQYLKTFKSY
jgi:hypothetical protein